MASLVLGAVGAVIGGVVGGPAGASLGWAIGSTLGGALFPGSLPDQVGPRLSDLKVQSSTYGTMIPIYYGTMRGAGNVIWSSDLVEHRTETESGGKGGPSQTSVSFSYSVSCAISLCEGPIAGVRRIWADSTLIYDASTGNAGATRIEGMQFKVYLGDETQMPDPTIEADKGAGNVPGYRGQAYVVFTDFPLDKFGNRTPNFSFEVVVSGTLADTQTDYDGAAMYDAGYRLEAEYNPITQQFWIEEWNCTTNIDAHISIRSRDDFNQEDMLTLRGDDYNEYQGLYYDSFNKRMWIFYVVPGTPRLMQIDAATGVTITDVLVDGNFILNVNPYSGMVYFCDGGYRYMGYSPDVEGSPYYFQTWETVDLISGDPGTTFTLKNQQMGRSSSVDQLHFTGEGEWAWASFYETYVYKLIDMATGSISKQFNLKNVLPASGVSDIGNFLLLPSSNTAWLRVHDTTDVTFGPGNSNRSGIVIVDLDRVGFSDFVVNAFVTAEIINSLDTAVYDKYRNVVWFLSAYSHTIYGYNVSDYSVYKSFYLGATVTWSANRIWVTPEAIYAVSETSDSCAPGILHKIILDRMTPTPVALSDVVSDLSVRAGLDTGDINVTALTDLVDGYAITRQAPVRSPAEQLQHAYFFDAVESDDIVKFVKRGGASAVTIAADDLAAHSYGEQLPDVISTTRAQEVELPSALNVLYLNPLADYQTSTQQSKRLIGASGEAVSVELPLVLSDDHAKQIADRSMFNAWTARTSHKFTTTNKYAKYEPTDVMTVDSKVLRVVKKDEAQGIIRWEAVAELAAIYTQAGTGVAAPSNGQTIAVGGYTNLQLLDIPMARDQDDDAGFYYVAAGYLAGWTGAVLYKSSDAGATYSESGATTAAASIGTATAALANFSGGNVFDEANTLTVSMTSGTLSSTTELAVLNGANAAVIGSEIIQYKTATLNGDGTYTLSGLLRGRRGTEWAMAAHVIGDRFVALSTATLNRLATTSAEIGLERKYKGVTIGGTLAGTSAQNFTNNAVALKPYAPVLLGGGRAANDITINWVRRTRLGGEWRDNVDAAMGESAESYDVEIWDSTYTTLKRTFSALSSPTTPYTSAQQVTDFGTNQATIYVRVYQLSAAVGRGYALQGIV